MPQPTRARISFSSRAALLRLLTIRTPRCWTEPLPMLKPVRRGVDWITNRTGVRKGRRHREEAAHGCDRWREFPGNRSRNEGSRRVAVGQSASMVNIALGAVDKALAELKTTGRMTEAQKGSLNREMSDKVEQVSRTQRALA